VSRQGWDSVTIPGWRVRRGLPTVVRYGTRGFPGRGDAGTRGRGRQLFAGGAGGTAELTQRIPLRTAAGKAVPSGSRFRLAAWLGGTRTSAAELRVRFFSAAGRPLGRRRIGPVGGSGSARHPDFAWRQRSGLLPSGGQTAYVVNYGSDTVTQIATRTSRAGRPIPVGQAPDAIAVTPDGKAAYVVDGDFDAVTPIATATGDPGRPIAVGYAPAGVTISRSGRTAYVVNTISGTVTPIAVATGRAARAIPVGRYGYPLVIALGPAGCAEVLDTYAGQVTPVDTATGHSLRRITVGGYPVAVAIAP
jgi:YVTN family beta-propeller protein